MPMGDERGRVVCCLSAETRDGHRCSRSRLDDGQDVQLPAVGCLARAQAALAPRGRFLAVRRCPAAKTGIRTACVASKAALRRGRRLLQREDVTVKRVDSLEDLLQGRVLAPGKPEPPKLKMAFDMEHLRRAGLDR